MAIPKASSTVEANLAGFESAKFSIAVNNKSFRVLLDTLYTNKIKAVVRELWTNAYDSHIAADCADKPFRVKLPSLLDPIFAVRDFGISLNHDQVMHLYTTVFQSTKDATNTFVGQLGLGSKSPFAYTDSFTVTCWQDGIKRLYLAGLGEDGVPTITHLFTEESDEPTGLEVSFPVQAKHFLEFRSECEQVAMGFDVVPEIENGDPIVVPQPMLSGDNWRVYANTPDGIRQGCVVYPVHKHQITYSTGLVHNRGLVVDVPIGTVDIAANREALSLDDDTAEAVKVAFREASEAIKAYFQRELDDAKNYLEATKLYNQYKSLFNYAPKMNFKGREITGFIEFPAGHKLTPKMFGEKDKLIVKPTFLVSQLDDAMFIIDRTDQKVPRKRLRIKRYRKDHEWSSKSIVVVQDPTPKQLEAMVRRLGLRPDQVVPVVKLPDVTVNKSGAAVAGPGTKSGVYTVRDGHWSISKVNADEVEDDFYWLAIDKGIPTTKVPLVGFKNQWGGDQVRPLEDICCTIRDTLKVLDLDDRPVYYLTLNAQKRLNVADRQEDLVTTVIKEALEEIKETIMAAARWHGLTYAMRYGNRDYLLDMVEDSWLLDYEAHEAVHSWALSSYFVNALFNNEKSQAIEQGREYARTFNERFPLLFGTSGSTDHIKNYIEFCKTLPQTNQASDEDEED